MVSELMETVESGDATVAVVGLGYVGRPLAEALAETFDVVGYDIDADRIAELGEADFRLTGDPAALADADIIVLCVPTPVTASNDPDLATLRSAAATVGDHMTGETLVVVESTVPPGATMDRVVPVLEERSGMAHGDGFAVGYSPERINPGDDRHTIDTVTKIVAGDDPGTAEILAELYGTVTDVHVAPDIETAEAAKVLENVQRDLNIALVNETALLCQELGLDTRDVLAAAGTKWNFHEYHPGIVGGHCIPVDPHFLVSRAEEEGFTPYIIKAGRSVNSRMPEHVATMTVKALNAAGKAVQDGNVLVAGVTYKAEVDDPRHSPVTELVRELQEFGVDVTVHDPLLAPAELERFDADAVRQLPADGAFEAVVLATPHARLVDEMDLDRVADLTTAPPVLVDVEERLDRAAARDRNIVYRSL